MSSQYPTTINAAIAAIFEHIAPNSNGEIDALKLRGVLMDILLGIYDTFAQPDDALLAQFPAYDPFNEYEGGTEVVVSYDDRLWLFVSPMDSTGQFPGSNAGVWQPFNVLGLAHFKNLDTWLDKPGPFAVSAQQLREHLEDEALHSAGVLISKGLLTPAQIQNSNTSEIDLILAPGSTPDSKILIPTSVTILKSAGTAYTTNTTARIKFKGDPGNRGIEIPLSNYVRFFNQPFTAANLPINKGIVFTTDDGDPEFGTFSIYYEIHYLIIDNPFL